MFLDPDIKDRLNTKLLKTVMHLEDQESKKRAIAAGFNYEIKSAKCRILALTETLHTGDMTALNDIFDSEEIDLGDFIIKLLKKSDTLKPKVFPTCKLCGLYMKTKGCSKNYCKTHGVSP